MRMLDGGGNRKSGPGQQTFWTASNRTHIPGIPFKIRARALYITQAAAFKIIERNITRACAGKDYYTLRRVSCCFSILARSSGESSFMSGRCWCMVVIVMFGK